MMSFSEIVKNKPLLYGLIGFAVVFFLFTRLRGNDSTSTLPINGLDPNLLALSVQSNLEQQKIAASKEIALGQLSNERYITSANNATALGLVNAEFSGNAALAEIGLKNTVIRTNADLVMNQRQNELAGKSLDYSHAQALKQMDITDNAGQRADALKRTEMGNNFALWAEQGRQALEQFKLTNVLETLKANLSLDALKNTNAHQLEAVNIESNAAIEAARLNKDAQIGAAKASKQKGVGFSCCGVGFNLGF